MKVEQVIMMIVHLILAASIAVYPFLSKRNIAFGIKMPLNFYENRAVKNIRYVFITMIVSVGVVMTLVSGLFLSEMMSLVILFGALFLYFMIYLYAHVKMKHLKKSEQWLESKEQKTVISTEFRKRRLTVPYYWHGFYIIIFVVTIGVALVKYESLPSQLPVQMNSLGETSRMMPKFEALTYQIGLQFVVMLLMMFVQYIIKAAKQDLSNDDITQSLEDNVRFRYNISKIIFALGAIVGLTFMFSVFMSLLIIKSLTVFLALTMGSTFGITILLIVFSVKYGQDGSRLMIKDSRPEGDFIDKEDDRYWKLGMIYFNKKDPSVFISKRVGVGWSVNHARWQAWAFYILIIAFIVVVSIIS